MGNIWKYHQLHPSCSIWDISKNGGYQVASFIRDNDDEKKRIWGHPIVF